MANMFKCVLQSASSSGFPLVVTCASAFAGLTITCSDGTTTLTDTCPSASPYEITFNLPNAGTWTVSGTISGTTFTESILVSDFEVTLKNTVDISVDVYGAASDTVSYTGLDGQTHTISTDTDGHATATITINVNGSTITFTSSVAKDSSNLSNAYTKSISLTSATTAIYVCPDGALYWYGYKKMAMSPQAYRQSGTNVAKAPTVTYNTNNVYIEEVKPSSNANRGVWITDNVIDISSYSNMCAIAHDAQRGMSSGGYPGLYSTATHADGWDRIDLVPFENTTSNPQVFTSTLDKTGTNNQYFCVAMISHNQGYKSYVTVDAIWLE